MAQPDDYLYDDLFDIIQKDKTLTDKKQLLEAMFMINDESIAENKKTQAYERLMQYLANMPKWDDELVNYMGTRFARSKTKK
ncbi:MAG: hypothetical protein H7259_02165 [Cytophagales bacterium]|nr:hypothetical protein [Cytophaga sp.]